MALGSIVGWGRYRWQHGSIAEAGRSDSVGNTAAQQCFRIRSTWEKHCVCVHCCSRMALKNGEDRTRRWLRYAVAKKTVWHLASTSGDGWVLPNYMNNDNQYDALIGDGRAGVEAPSCKRGVHVRTCRCTPHLTCVNLLSNGSLAAHKVQTQSAQQFARYGKRMCTCARADATHPDLCKARNLLGP